MLRFLWLGQLDFVESSFWTCEDHGLVELRGGGQEHGRKGEEFDLEANNTATNYYDLEASLEGL